MGESVRWSPVLAPLLAHVNAHARQQGQRHQAEPHARRAFSQDVIFEAGLLTQSLLPHRQEEHTDDRYWDGSYGAHYAAQTGAYHALNVALLDTLARHDECSTGAGAA